MTKNLTYILSLVLIISFSNISFAQSTLYVNANNGNDANNGLKRTEAFQTISAAINAASNGDIIRVSTGLYNEQLDINKRIQLIGSGVSTVIERPTGLVMNITAPQFENLSVGIYNLSVTALSSGSAITINSSKVKISDVKAKGTSQRAIQINSTVEDIKIHRSEIYGSNIGLLVNDDIEVDGLEIWNCNFYSNTNHAISFRESNPTIAGMVKNVSIKNSVFKDNNPNNINLGHVIYMEKLSNAVFENISIYTPLTNVQNAIDINLKWRNDYEDIKLHNILINRETEGVGIFVKGRDDAPLYDGFPGSVRDISITGSKFNGCRNNIRIENNVTDITVNRCDLSNFNQQQGNAIVNLSTAFSPLNADNNYFGTTSPTVGLGYVAASLEGSNEIYLMPIFNSSEIMVGMYAFGQNLPFGTTVTAVNDLVITLSNPVSATMMQDAFLFTTTIFPASHVQRAASNDLSILNPLQHKLVNSLNQSFPSLETALLGTAVDESIYLIEPTVYPGGTFIDRNISFNTAGAGVLDQNSIARFDNLIVNDGVLNLNMDIEVVNQLTLQGTLVIDDQQINLDGKIGGSGKASVTEFSSMNVTGSDSVGSIRFDENASTLGRLIYDRTNNGVLNIASDVYVNDIQLLSGVIAIPEMTLHVNAPEFKILNNNAFITGNVALQVASVNTTFELLFPTGGDVSGRRDFTLSLQQTSAVPNYYSAAMIEESSYDLDFDLPEGIDRISPIRYWYVSKGEDAEMMNANATIQFKVGDLVTDEVSENLKMLKENAELLGAWLNIGGVANPPVEGIITSDNITNLGFFTLGNVEGGLNFIPDTIYVDAIIGNDAFNGLTPIVGGAGSPDGPKLTINAGIESASSTGVVSIVGAYYPERVIFNKRISLVRRGVEAVSADTLVIKNAVSLQPLLPSETDFAINTVDLESGAKLSDGFLLVAEDGVVYLRDESYNENVSTNKSFVIKGLGESTVQTINLNGQGNILTIGTPFIVGESLNLNATTGSKVIIFNDNLTVDSVQQITGVSAQSYIITNGDGFVKLNNLTDAPTLFPIGTSTQFAPVTIDNVSNSGDKVGARVKFAETRESFEPNLPNTVTSFVQLQWTLTEEMEGGKDAKLYFDFGPDVLVGDFNNIPGKVVASNNGEAFWTENDNIVYQENQLGAGVYASIKGNYALYSSFTINVEELFSQHANVFPNPFESFINLQFNEAFAGNIRLTDITGKTVYNTNITSHQNESFQFNIPSELSTGMYFLILNDGNQSRTLKLMKK
jgi:hypothetical protein